MKFNNGKELLETGLDVVLFHCHATEIGQCYRLPKEFLASLEQEAPELLDAIAVILGVD